jgi:hypothetical protein
VSAISCRLIAHRESISGAETCRPREISFAMENNPFTL